MKEHQMSQPDISQPIEDTELNKDQIEDILNDETEPEDKEEDKLKIEVPEEEEDDKEEEDEEEEGSKEEKEEVEDEDEDIDKEKLDLIAPARRADILKEFPKLFDKFPYLETAYYRDQRFTEIFGTVADAEAARERVEAVDGIEAELMEGNTESILKAIKDENPEAFNKVADDYLLTLANVDKDAYYHVVGNEMKKAMISMVQQADSLGKEEGDSLRGAAHILHKFLFGPGAQWSPPAKLFKGETDDKGKSELERERQEFARERFETAREDLSGKLERTLQATIDENIDPRGEMTDYVKRHATREALDALQELIQQDTRFVRIYDKLW